MALTECPECGGRVSDKATACPHCGFPVSEAVGDASPELRNDQEQMRALRPPSPPVSEPPLAAGDANRDALGDADDPSTESLVDAALAAEYVSHTADLDRTNKDKDQVHWSAILIALVPTILFSSWLIAGLKGRPWSLLGTLDAIGRSRFFWDVVLWIPLSFGFFVLVLTAVITVRILLDPNTKAEDRKASMGCLAIIVGAAVLGAFLLWMAAR